MGVAPAAVYQVLDGADVGAVLAAEGGVHGVLAVLFPPRPCPSTIRIGQ